MLKIEDCYISYVNLSHRKDRLDHMRNQLEKVGLTAYRTPGILPNDCKGDRKRFEFLLKRTPGAFGCWESQVQIMEKALMRGQHAFIMEDDVILSQDVQKRLSYLENWSKTHSFDILWGGGTYHLPAFWHTGNNPDLQGAYLGRDAELTDDPRMIRTYGAFSTHCYIVHKDSIEKVLKMLDRVTELSYGIDHAMIRIQPELLTYAMCPGWASQLDNQSDIGRGMTIFSGFRMLGKHWFSDDMDSFDPSTYDWKDAKIK